MYDIETIAQPRTLAEAIAALEADPTAFVIAGGTDVLLQVREGEKAGCSLVSIHQLPGLAYAKQDEVGVELGALTTFAQLEEDALVRETLPLLAEAAGQMGGPQIRRVATVGGNVCRGLTSADSAPALLCYNASLCLTGPTGSRELPMSEFYTGPGKVALGPAELLTALRVRKEDYSGYFGHYIKYATRAAMDIAMLGTAVLVRLSADKRSLADVRLAFGVAAPIPMRAKKTEAALTGLATAEAVSQIAALVRGEINPRDSWRAGREFRLQVAGECAQRALKQAIIDAGGEC